MSFSFLSLAGSPVLVVQGSPNTFDPLLLGCDPALGLDPLRAPKLIAQYPVVMAACILGFISLAVA